MNKNLDLESIAKNVWHLNYPERRPWCKLERSTQLEWIKFLQNAILALENKDNSPDTQLYFEFMKPSLPC